MLVSDSFPAGRTAIGHIARNGDYVVIVHKDRRFAGRLIGAHAYEAYGFDPFAVVAELPAADAALRAAVEWGNALTEAAASVVAAEATGDDTVLWQAPTDMFSGALARALFLSGAPGQRRADYFSLSLQDLPYQRSVLTRLADHDGQRRPRRRERCPAVRHSSAHRRDARARTRAALLRCALVAFADRDRSGGAALHRMDRERDDTSAGRARQCQDRGSGDA